MIMKTGFEKFEAYVKNIRRCGYQVYIDFKANGLVDVMLTKYAYDEKVFGSTSTLGLDYTGLLKFLENLQRELDTKIYKKSSSRMKSILGLPLGFDNLLEDFPDHKEFLCTTTLKIKKVHFSGPCTIVVWSDGTKTVVKCSHDEAFDSEKGLAMAIAKKALGNKGNYYNEFKKWLPKEEDNSAAAALKRIGAALRRMK